MTSPSVCVPLMLVLLMLGESSSSSSTSQRICCTKYDTIRAPIAELLYYVVQDVTEFCNLKATIFQTLRGEPLCSNPDRKWVKKAMQVVPRLDQWRMQIRRR